MTDPAWQRVGEILELALQRPAAERAAFVRRACGGDAALAAEVLSLLAEHESADGFLEGPPPAVREAMGSDTLLGATLDGKYRLEGVLGEGGMATVYRARQVALDRAVAVKVAARELGARSDAIERFRREAVAVARLRHPHIVAVHDSGVDAAAGAYLVMELLEGHLLRTELARFGRLPLDTACAIMRQLCAALQAAHDAGVVHRDLKPENVFLVHGGTVHAKVLDFGVAKLFDADKLTRTGVILGTPAYMAPEQFRGGAVDARTDVYALGCLLYEMATGRAPFRGESVGELLDAHLRVPPEPPRRLRPNLPAPIEDAILRALAKRPDDRFARAADLALAIDAHA